MSSSTLFIIPSSHFSSLLFIDLFTLLHKIIANYILCTFLHLISVPSATCTHEELTPPTPPTSPPPRHRESSLLRGSYKLVTHHHILPDACAMSSNYAYPDRLSLPFGSLFWPVTSVFHISVILPFHSTCF